MSHHDKVLVPLGIKSVRLTTTAEKEYNISGMVYEISIHEDIFSNTMSGSILLTDYQSFLNVIEFSGGEKITFELVDSDKGEEIILLEFIVYAIKDRVRLNNASETFTLEFTSVETLLNESTRAKTALFGQNSKSVSSLFSSIGSKKKIDVEETSGMFKSVMPSWTPFAGINWYAGRSVSALSGGSYFLFYETIGGFRFDCIETLIKEKEIYEYFYEPSNTEVGVDRANIRAYEVINFSEYLEGYNSNHTTLYAHDLIRKKIVKQDYDILKDNKGVLNKKLFLKDENGFGISLTERRSQNGNRVIFKPETRNVHSQTTDYVYDSIQPKISAISQFETIKVRFLVFGNRKITPGKVIRVNIPKSAQFTKENKEDLLDETLTGRYLVTAVRSIIKSQDFQMVIEAIKDSK